MDNKFVKLEELGKSPLSKLFELYHTLDLLMIYNIYRVKVENDCKDNFSKNEVTKNYEPA